LAYYSVPAIRRLQLGRELKAWREKGRGAIHPLHARAMAELYRVPEDDVVELVEIARKARQPNQNRIEGVSVNSYPALEAEAVSVRNFELASVPGLLQTEDYAAAFFAENDTRPRSPSSSGSSAS